MAVDSIAGLKEAIGSGNAVAVVGAGVSMAAAGKDQPCASWTGLLHHGVFHCAEYVKPLPKGWAKRVHAEIDSGDLDDMLSAAEKISRKLGAPKGGEYARWLEQSVGALAVEDGRVIRALGALGIPLITTNYDGLLEAELGLDKCTWLDGAQWERVIRRDKDAVFHLHGYWERPESVILSIRSYVDILRDEHAQAMLRALRALRTLVFVGCGEGLGDPNFEALLDWARKAFAGSTYHHYRLACEKDIDAVRAQHTQDDRIKVVSYGEDYDALAGFLEGLASARPKPPKRPAREKGSDEAAAFVAAFRERLKAQHARWDLRYVGATQAGGAGAPVAPSLEEMYLPLRLHEKYDINELDRGAVLPPDKVLARKKPLVVRGAAGCGKTTWMRYTFRELLGNEGALPIMVELRRLVREWTEEGVGPGNRSLDDYIARWAADAMGDGFDKEGLVAALRAEAGPRPVLLVDGWDETGDLGEDLRAKLAGFMNTHPRVFVVVSSRPYGEGRPSHSEGFEELNVQPLSDDEIRQFATNFFTRCYHDDHMPAEESIAEFMAALERAPEAQALGRTALLLTMMLLISRSSPLPDKRHKLYDKCVENLLTALPDRYDDEGVKLRHVHWRPESSDERLRAAANLAHGLQDKAYSKKSRHAIVAGWEEAEKHLPPHWTPRQRSGFLAWLAERAGLLLDFADGRLSFSHLSFQEYLCARHLSASIEGDGKRKDAFVEKAEVTTWWETLRLWAALIEARNPDLLAPVLDALMQDEDRLWAAGTIFADGVGSSAVFESWAAHLAASLKSGWHRHTNTCAQA